MKKRLTIIVLLFAMVLSLFACNKNDTSSNDAANEQSDTTASPVESSTDSAFSPVTASTVPAEENLTFDEANILKFELLNRDDQSYKEIISTFKVTNIGKKAVDYFSAKYVYYDKDGNVICDDGRYNDFQIASGKSVLATSYSDLDESFKKSDISEIKVDSYYYYVGNQKYDINIGSQLVKTYNHSVKKDLDFDQADILSFEYDDKGLNSIDSYEVSTKIYNHSTKKIIYCSIRMAYLDKDGTCLDKDGRFNKSSFDVGKFTTIKSFMTNRDYSRQVASYGVFEYKYQFAEDDENGFNTYTVNLQTKEVSGYHSNY